MKNQTKVNEEQSTELMNAIGLQDRCKVMSEKINSLQKAISDQEEIKAKARSAVPSMQSLNNERENLLAKIALGEASQKDLDSFDKKYAKELTATREARQLSESIISSADQTIAGLRRCLNNAELELTTLTDQKDSARLDFLRSEVEKVGAEYLDLAYALTEKYKRIVGIEVLMRKFTANPGIRTANGDIFKIPMFNLPVFKNLLQKEPAGTFPDAHIAAKFHSSLDVSRDAEKERMAKLGVDLD
ncbi:MAG TPA: hypothetical protein PKM56_17920 [Candidatus Rifleibacterium sp.]|nr:hypothetical protein [Candidatus Rifleibacterium sp.]